MTYRNRMIMCLTVCFSLFYGVLASSNANAQFVLQGKIVDSESGDAIPFVNIQIVNTGYGTAGNDLGEFLFKIDPGHFNDSLKV